MKSRQLWALLRFALTAVAMFAAWMMFTASIETFSLISGAVGSLLIAALTYDEFLAPHEASLNSFMPKPLFLIVYLFYLLYAMYRSSFQMLAAVFGKDVNPRIVHFRTRMKSDLGRMILSNSITFTPGTITLDLNDDHLVVHWFFCDTVNSRAAGEAVKGTMEKLLRKVWQ